MEQENPIDEYDNSANGTVDGESNDCLKKHDPTGDDSVTTMDKTSDQQTGRSCSKSPIRRSRSRSRGYRSRSRSCQRSKSPRGRKSRSRSRRRRSRSDSRGRRRRRSRSRSGGRGGGGRSKYQIYSRPTREPEEGCKLHVGNLGYDTDVPELEAIFGKFGKLTDVFVPHDNYTGRSKGFGFVTFEESRDAADAMRDLDGSEIEGRRVMVEHARPRRRAPRGGGRGGGGYRGGGGRERDYERRSRRGSYGDSRSRGRSNERGYSRD